MRATACSASSARAGHRPGPRYRGRPDRRALPVPIDGDPGLADPAGVGVLAALEAALHPASQYHTGRCSASPASSRRSPARPSPLSAASSQLRLAHQVILGRSCARPWRSRWPGRRSSGPKVARSIHMTATRPACSSSFRLAMEFRVRSGCHGRCVPIMRLPLSAASSRPAGADDDVGDLFGADFQHAKSSGVPDPLSRRGQYQLYRKAARYRPASTRSMSAAMAALADFGTPISRKSAFISSVVMRRPERDRAKCEAIEDSNRIDPRPETTGRALILKIAQECRGSGGARRCA